jgi:Tol biopolymer transport system component
MNHAGQREYSGTYLGSLSAAGTPGRLLVRAEANALYESGYILFLRQSDLMAPRFDLGRMELRGDPVRMAEKALNDQGIWRGAFSVSGNGLLIYATGANAAAEGQLTWFDASGKVVGTIGERGNNDPRVSPDGHKVALTKYGGPNPEVWIFDTANGLRTRQSTDAAGTTPVWSPDGKNIVYIAIPENTSKARLAVRAADGSGDLRLLYQEEQWQSPSDWSPDGKYVLYSRGEPGASHIWVMPVAQGEKPFPFVATQDWERDAVFSPDGHWVAYTSRQSGRDEVYVAPFPGKGQRSQISSIGASTPRWRHDGKALYAVSSVNGDDVLEFPISTLHDNIQTGDPKILFRTAVGQTLLYSAGYDVGPDGRLLINTLGESRTGSRPLTLVANWPASINH